MKSVIFASAVVFYFYSSLAFAQVTQIQLGQHHNARNGEVTIVNYGGMSSTVVCGNGGGGTIPQRQMFDYTHTEFYERSTIDIYPYQTLQSNCQRYASLPEPKQAIAMATMAAREKCFQYYNRCAPPGREAEQYHFNFLGHGRPGCEVTAFMIGTEPRL